jgi:hypothetical protein
VKAVSDKHRRGIGRNPKDDSFALNLPRHILPVIAARRFTVLVNIEAHSVCLIGCFVPSVLITIDSEIVADFDALTTSQVDVGNIIRAVLQLKAFAGDQHPLFVSARRREPVKVILGFQRRGRALGERQQDIAPLHGAARTFHLGDGNIRLGHDHAKASFVFPNRSHLVRQRRLPAEPRDSTLVCHRADHLEFVTDFDALA